MRVLVYHNGALGDFITTIPALRLVRIRAGGAHITLLGSPACASLAREQGLIDDAVDASSRACSSLFALSPAPELAERLRACDLALLFSASPSLIQAVAALVPRTLDHPPFPDRHVSAYRYHADFVAEAVARQPGCACADGPALERAFRAPLLGTRARPTRPAVIIHPGSSSRVKTWPVDRYLDVAASLRRRGLRVAWSFGPADEELRRACAGRVGDDEVLVGASPVDLARLLSASCLYIGVDSGVSHLAAATGCPSVLVFGPTSLEVWRPPGPHVRALLRRDSCPAACEIPPRGDRCSTRQSGLAGGPARCMLAVEPGEVLDAAAELLETPEGALAPPSPSG